MKMLNKYSVLRPLSAVAVLVLGTLLYSQIVIKTIKHTASGGTSGNFSVVSTDMQNFKKTTVKEISISVMSGTGKNIVISADLVDLAEPKASGNNITATVKSYSDPGYSRKEKTKSDEAEEIVNGSESDTEEGVGEDDEYGSVPKAVEPQEEKDPYENINDQDVPAKMYLELIADGTESTYSFYDKNDLESIINGINSQYGTNFEVAGSGRNVYVSRSAAQKREVEKTVNKRVNLTKSDLENGSYLEVLKFDIAKLESELLKDKVLTKNQIKSYTFLIEKEELYVNGNKISDKLTAKYRKIFANFSFDYSDD